MKHPGDYDVTVLDAIAQDVAIASKIDFQFSNLRRYHPASSGEVFERKHSTTYRINGSVGGGWIYCDEPIVKPM
jgi:hypothetical protein